jgi:hypothetical protein
MRRDTPHRPTMINNVETLHATSLHYLFGATSYRIGITYLRLSRIESLKYVIPISLRFVLPSVGELLSSLVLAHNSCDH